LTIVAVLKTANSPQSQMGAKPQDRTFEFTRTTESNEGSTPRNGIEAGKRTTESNQGSNHRIRNPKSEIQNPQFE